MLCSVVIIYLLFSDAQIVMMKRRRWRVRGVLAPGSLLVSTLGQTKVFDGMLETMDSCYDACTSVCVLATCVFCSVLKLNIVCVLSANALECISLEIFLRNGLAPVRAKCPY